MYHDPNSKTVDLILILIIDRSRQVIHSKHIEGFLNALGMMMKTVWVMLSLG